MSKISFVPSTKEKMLTAQEVVVLSSTLDAALRQYESLPQQKTFIATLNNRNYEVTLLSRSNGKVSISLDGDIYDVHLTPLIQRAVTSPTSAAPTQASAPLQQELSSDMFYSPIAGTITSINIEKEGAVDPGTLLCTIEAMKMENTIKAGGSFIIEEILIRPGDVVKKNQPLFKKKV